MFNPFQHAGYHIYQYNGKKETIDTLLEGKNKHIWEKSLCNEWRRLAQGNIHRVRNTNMIDFVHKSELPKKKAVMYATFVCDYRALKYDPYRVCITVGGEKLTYNDDSGSPAANLLEKN